MKRKKETHGLLSILVDSLNRTNFILLDFVETIEIPTKDHSDVHGLYNSWT